MKETSTPPIGHANELLAIIEQTQALIQEAAYRGVATAWLPLSKSLSEKKAPVQTPTTNSRPLVSSAHVPATDLSFQAPKPLSREQTPPPSPPLPPHTPKTAIPPESQENKPHSPLEKSIKKVGKFTLHLPQEITVDTHEVYDWLKKRGVIDQTSPKPKMVLSQKIALSPAVILVHPTSSYKEGLQRLSTAINEKLTACCLVEEEGSLHTTLYEAIERGRIHCLIVDPSLKSLKELPQSPHILALEPEDLSENKRKIELWKRVSHLLGPKA